MAKLNKATIDKDLRDHVFADMMGAERPVIDYQKINDRQYGALMTDLNGHIRYVRVGVIVAEERDDMSAEELMVAEIEAYQMKQAEKAEKAQKRAAKAEKDKARRKAEAEAKAKDKESEEV